MSEQRFLTGDDILVVTGAAGFIGSNVARRLTEAGYRVVGVDRMGGGGKWRNLVGVSLHDLIRPESLWDYLARLGDKIGAVLHMGAISATTELDVDRLLRDNIRATLDLRDWTRVNGTRFIYASSAATYGGGEQGFLDGTSLSYLRELRPLNPYGWSKAFVDLRIVDELSSLADKGSWAGLKFFNVYGPGEDHKGEMRSVINKIMPKILAGETIQLFKSHRDGFVDGGQKRDFVHVTDCVEMIEWLLANPHVSGLFNVGSGTARSFTDLALATFRSLGHHPRIQYVDMPEALRDKYQYFTQADMSRARVAGFQGAGTSLEAGIEAYARSWATSYGRRLS